MAITLQKMMATPSFGDVIRSNEMPDLAEDDIIEQILMPELLIILIQEDMQRPELSAAEQHEMAEAIRMESTCYGEQRFPVDHMTGVSSSWSPGMLSKSAGRVTR
jgi:hypothetical protein